MIRRTTTRSRVDALPKTLRGATAQMVEVLESRLLLSTSSVTATLTGAVFNDANADGARDSSEAGVENVRVFLDYAGTGVWNAAKDPSARTNSSGVFTFTKLAAGQYHIGFVPPANAVRTAPPGDLVASVVAGKTVNAGAFGVYFLAPGTTAIAGVVYKYHNVNGVMDSGDGPLANVKVYLDLNGNDVLDKNERSVLTDSSGAYTFSNLKPGAYEISQVVPAGYRQGFPFGGSENTATVAAGALAAQRNFGDTTTSRVSGYVYANTNKQGTGPGQTGLAAVTVIVKPASGSGTTYTVQTNSAGYYVAGALPNQAYTVTLVAPSGYTLVSGSLTRTTAVLHSGQTADNIDFVGMLAVPVTFISQNREIGADYGFDPAYSSGNFGPPIQNTGPQGRIATGFGLFDSSTESGRQETGNMTPQDPVHDITVDGKSSQTSSLSPSELSDSGSVSATENDGDGSAGSTFASADSFFQVSFQVAAAERYSLSAVLSEIPPLVAGSATYGAAYTLTLTGPGGKQLLLPPTSSDSQAQTTDSFKQSGTLAVGTYTLTLDVTARDQDDNFPSAMYNLDLKFG